MPQPKRSLERRQPVVMVAGIFDDFEREGDFVRALGTPVITHEIAQPASFGDERTVSVVLVFAGIDVNRRYLVKIVAHDPGGYPFKTETASLRFDGTPAARALVAKLDIPLWKSGTVWIDVLIDDQHRTSIPYVLIEQ
jgi:hypothetical protein